MKIKNLEKYMTEAEFQAVIYDLAMEGATHLIFTPCNDGIVAQAIRASTPNMMRAPLVKVIETEVFDSLEPVNMIGYICAAEEYGVSLPISPKDIDSIVWSLEAIHEALNIEDNSIRQLALIDATVFELETNAVLERAKNYQDLFEEYGRDVEVQVIKKRD